MYGEGVELLIFKEASENLVVENIPSVLIVLCCEGLEKIVSQDCAVFNLSFPPFSFVVGSLLTVLGSSFLHLWVK